MSKWLTVVAFVLLVLAGSVGLRNIVASLNGSSAVTIRAQGGPVPPMPPPGGRH